MKKKIVLITMLIALLLVSAISITSNSSMSLQAEDGDPPWLTVRKKV